jgi:hypothetical protein
MNQLLKIPYGKTDNQGVFSKTDFNNPIKTQDLNETFDENVEQINNEIKSSMNQIDNQKNFINTSTDQNIQVIESTKPPPPDSNRDTEGNILSKKGLRQQNKKNKSTANTSKSNVNTESQVNTNKSTVITEPQVNGSIIPKAIELNIPQKIIEITNKLDNQNQQIKQAEASVFKSFTD